MNDQLYYYKWEAIIYDDKLLSSLQNNSIKRIKQLACVLQPAPNWSVFCVDKVWTVYCIFFSTLPSNSAVPRHSIWPKKFDRLLDTAAQLAPGETRGRRRRRGWRRFYGRPRERFLPRPTFEMHWRLQRVARVSWWLICVGNERVGILFMFP